MCVGACACARMLACLCEEKTSCRIWHFDVSAGEVVSASLLSIWVLREQRQDGMSRDERRGGREGSNSREREREIKGGGKRNIDKRERDKKRAEREREMENRTRKRGER